jgi:hypothetical protein
MIGISSPDSRRIEGRVRQCDAMAFAFPNDALAAADLPIRRCLYGVVQSNGPLT